MEDKIIWQGYEIVEFVMYIKEQLIPSLEDSEMHETAKDIKQLVRIIEFLDK